MFKKLLVATAIAFSGVNVQADIAGDLDHVRERLSAIPDYMSSQVEAELYAEVLFKEAMINSIEAASEFSVQTNFSELQPRPVQISAAVATGFVSLYLTRSAYRLGGGLLNAITPNEQMTSFTKTARNFKKEQIRFKSLMEKANQRAASSASPMTTGNYRAVAARLNSRILQSRLNALDHSALRPGLAYNSGRAARFLGRGALVLVGISVAVTIVNHTVVIVSLPSDSVDDVLTNLRDDVNQIEEALVQAESARITDADLDEFVQESN